MKYQNLTKSCDHVTCLYGLLTDYVVDLAMPYFYA
jgi:hypothetical protein